MTFTGREFKSKFCSPIVYCWIRNGEYLYVGASGEGFQRTTSKLHRVMARENIEDTDIVEIHYFNSKEDALRAEHDLQQEHDPLYCFKQGPKREGEPYRDEVLDEILPTRTPKTKEERLREKIIKDALDAPINRRKK